MAVFIGSEAMARGELTRHDLRTHHRRLLPDVYALKHQKLTLTDKATAAYLWSHRQAVVAGLAASALHGARWVGLQAPVELVWPNHRAPTGVITRNDTLLNDEITRRSGLDVTTVERTAFDLARRGTIGEAVARLDALQQATRFEAESVLALAERHPRNRGLKRMPLVLDLMDIGAQSPQETWLRMLLIEQGFPRPETQIPVLRADRYSYYYLDMGWEDLGVAVEYDGEHHRKDPETYRNDIIRMEYVQRVGWIVVRVVAKTPKRVILARVRAALQEASRLKVRAAS
ncbi:hypothetical protein [Mycobacterium sp. 236(2023)]|uniref:hypothetical protein n=1 Tax=Mycobacterium sp. 236(2023) TaxID=3038163 RepID=UPI0024159630|nr:hypothetical protein [Mycobacterium sp. 236(2023)]MDG4664256.1 hypothetical protein [Mycobacterium sp. 236(2023)]